MIARTLKKLIRLHKMHLDQLQMQIAALTDQILEIDQKIQDAQADLEQQPIQAAADYYFTLPDYTHRVRDLIQGWIKLRQDLVIQQDGIREQIQQVFSDIKRYETLSNRVELALRQDIAKKLQAELDEIALRFRKRTV